MAVVIDVVTDSSAAEAEVARSIGAGAKAGAVEASAALSSSAKASSASLAAAAANSVRLASGTREASGEMASFAKNALAFAGGGALLEVIAKLPEAAEGMIKAGNQTNAVIASMGLANKVTKEQVDALAGSMSKQIGDSKSSIIPVENLLLRYKALGTGLEDTNSIYDKTLIAVENVSSATGKSATASARQFALALTDPAIRLSALTRLGIIFTKQQTDQIKAMQASGNLMGAQTIILDKLQKMYGGAAAAGATSVDKAKASVENLEAALGEDLMPALEVVSKTVEQMTPILSGTFGVIGAHIGTIEDIGKAYLVWKAATVWIPNTFSGIGNVVSSTSLKVSNGIRAEVAAQAQLESAVIAGEKASVDAEISKQAAILQTQIATKGAESAQAAATAAEIASLQALSAQYATNLTEVQETLAAVTALRAESSKPITTSYVRGAAAETVGVAGAGAVSAEATAAAATAGSEMVVVNREVETSAKGVAAANADIRASLLALAGADAEVITANTALVASNERLAISEGATAEAVTAAATAEMESSSRGVLAATRNALGTSGGFSTLGAKAGTAFGIALAGQVGASMIPENAKWQKELSSTLKDVTLGAAAGSFFGPEGTAVGALAGGLVAAASADHLFSAGNQEAALTTDQLKTSVDALSGSLAGVPLDSTSEEFKSFAASVYAAVNQSNFEADGSLTKTVLAVSHAFGVSKDSAKTFIAEYVSGLPAAVAKTQELQAQVDALGPKLVKATAAQPALGVGQTGSPAVGAMWGQYNSDKEVLTDLHTATQDYYQEALTGSTQYKTVVDSTIKAYQSLAQEMATIKPPQLLSDVRGDKQLLTAAQGQLAVTQGHLSSGKLSSSDTKTYTDNAKALEDYIKTLKSYTTGADEAHARTLTMIEGNNTLAQSNDTLADASTRYKNAAKSGKDATAEAQGALATYAKSWNDLDPAVQQTGGNLLEVKSKFLGAAAAMGYGRDDAIDLANKLLQIPTKITVVFETNADKTKQVLLDLKQLAIDTATEIAVGIAHAAGQASDAILAAADHAVASDKKKLKTDKNAPVAPLPVYVPPKVNDGASQLATLHQDAVSTQRDFNNLKTSIKEAVAATDLSNTEGLKPLVAQAKDYTAIVGKAKNAWAAAESAASHAVSKAANAKTPTKALNDAATVAEAHASKLGSAYTSAYSTAKSAVASFVQSEKDALAQAQTTLATTEQLAQSLATIQAKAAASNFTAAPTTPGQSQQSQLKTQLESSAAAAQAALASTPGLGAGITAALASAELAAGTYDSTLTALKATESATAAATATLWNSANTVATTATNTAIIAATEAETAAQAVEQAGSKATAAEVRHAAALAETAAQLTDVANRAQAYADRLAGVNAAIAGAANSADDVGKSVTDLKIKYDNASDAAKRAWTNSEIAAATADAAAASTAKTAQVADDAVTKAGKNATKKQLATKAADDAAAAGAKATADAADAAAKQLSDAYIAAYQAAAQADTNYTQQVLDNTKALAALQITTAANTANTMASIQQFDYNQSEAHKGAITQITDLQAVAVTAKQTYATAQTAAATAAAAAAADPSNSGLEQAAEQAEATAKAMGDAYVTAYEAAAQAAQQMADTVDKAFNPNNFTVQGAKDFFGKTIVGSALAQFQSGLDANKVNIAEMTKDFATLEGWGLDRNFVASLFQAGGSSLISDLVSAGQSTALATAGEYADNSVASSGLGAAVAASASDPVQTAQLTQLQMLVALTKSANDQRSGASVDSAAQTDALVKSLSSATGAVRLLPS